MVARKQSSKAMSDKPKYFKHISKLCYVCTAAVNTTAVELAVSYFNVLAEQLTKNASASLSLNRN